MLEANLVLLALLAGNSWTVDDDGPADFGQIGEAIAAAAVADGDLLVVEPGDYDGFVLDKDLVISGRAGVARPRSAGPVQVQASTFRFVRLELGGVTVQSVGGAATIEDCVLTGSAAQPIGLAVNQCSALLVSRSVIRGAPSDGFAGIGLRAIQSRLTLAEDAIFGSGSAAGVRLVQGCDLLFAGGAIFGGDALPQGGGAAGNGVELIGSEASVRGAAFDVVFPGAPSSSGAPGASFMVQDGSTLVLNEVLHFGVDDVGAGNVVVQADLAEPFLRNFGPNGLDSPGEVLLFGAPKQMGLLLLSEDDTLTPVPILDVPLWFDPSRLLFFGALVSQGSLFPVSCPYDVPHETSLIGRSFRFQVVFPGQPATLDPNQRAATNPVEVVIRP